MLGTGNPMMVFVHYTWHTENAVRLRSIYSQIYGLVLQTPNEICIYLKNAFTYKYKVCGVHSSAAVTLCTCADADTLPSSCLTLRSVWHISHPLRCEIVKIEPIKCCTAPPQNNTRARCTWRAHKIRYVHIRREVLRFVEVPSQNTHMRNEVARRIFPHFNCRLSRLYCVLRAYTESFSLYLSRSRYGWDGNVECVLHACRHACICLHVNKHFT